MMPRKIIKRKMKCSNPKCGYVYEISDVIYPVMNDNGNVIFKCPDCGALAKHSVCNVDVFENAKNNLSGRCVHDVEYLGDEKEEYKSVPFGVSRSVMGPESEYIELDNADIWSFDGVDIEVEARKQIDNKLVKEIANIKNGYLAGVHGMDSINRLAVKVELRKSLPYRYALFMKEVKSENDLTADGLVLVGVEGVSSDSLVDGVHDRNYCFAVLDMMLERWRMLCEEVFFVSPFIGLQYEGVKNDTQVRAFWQWLNASLDLGKTRFVTRKASFNRLKKAIDALDVKFEERAEWHDLDELMEAALQYDGRKSGAKDSAVQLFQKSHAKFYAGVYKDFVEVVSASYNIHLGGYLENMTYKRYPKKVFEKLYLKPFGLKLRNLDNDCCVAMIDATEGKMQSRIISDEELETKIVGAFVRF